MTMISEPTSRVQPYSSAVTGTSSGSPEIQLTALVRAASDAIQSEPGARYNDEAAGRWFGEGGASGAASAEDDS